MVRAFSNAVDEVFSANAAVIAHIARVATARGTGASTVPTTLGVDVARATADVDVPQTRGCRARSHTVENIQVGCRTVGACPSGVAVAFSIAATTLVQAVCIASAGVTAHFRKHPLLVAFFPPTQNVIQLVLAIRAHPPRKARAARRRSARSMVIAIEVVCSPRVVNAVSSTGRDFHWRWAGAVSVEVLLPRDGAVVTGVAAAALAHSADAIAAFITIHIRGALAAGGGGWSGGQRNAGFRRRLQGWRRSWHGRGSDGR